MKKEKNEQVLASLGYDNGAIINFIKKWKSEIKT